MEPADAPDEEAVVDPAAPVEDVAPVEDAAPPDGSDPTVEDGAAGEAPPVDDGRPFSEQLKDWLEADGPKTLGALDATFGERSFAVAVLLLMFLPALPLPTGGITHVFEAITVIIAAQLVIGRRSLWLPKKWKHRELGGVTTEKALPWMMRRIRWFEKFSRNRGDGLFDNVWVRRLLGLIFIVFAVGAAFAPPFSGLDTLPAMGAVGVALGVILGDVVVLGIGFAIGVGGITLMVTLGAAIARFFQSLF